MYIILGLIIMLIIYLYLYFNSYNVSIYYINLDKSTDRKEKMTKQLHKYNINKFKRINAVTPEKISKQYKKLFSHVCRHQTEIEIACLMSHLKAIHTAYINGDDYALILEDDVIINRMVHFNNILKTAPNDWEILQLHVLNYNIYDKDKDLWIPYSTQNWSTAAYIINRKGMIHVLSVVFRNFQKGFNNLQINWGSVSKLAPCVADFLIYNIAKTYSCNDLLFITPAKESTIHTSHLPIHKLHEDKIMEYFTKHGYKNKDIGY